MILIAHSKKLSNFERYPCSIGLLKRKFSDTDIHIGIGLKRDYSFDYLSRNRPCIKGKIVTSLSINKRYSLIVPDGQLRVFPIDRSIYSDKNASEFDSLYIDEMIQWYNVQLEDDLISCVSCMLIEYYHGTFIIHYLRYQ